MRVSRSLVAVAVLVASATLALEAQTIPAVRLPPSPPGQSAVQLGGRWEKTADAPRYVDGKWVVVDYGRPLLRGRTNIFGASAEYGKVVSDGSPVWRMGANDSTQLTTQVSLSIGGKTLKPGVYNAFDWRYAVPVSVEFPQRTIVQDGRSFLFSAEAAF